MWEKLPMISNNHKHHNILRIYMRSNNQQPRAEVGTCYCTKCTASHQMHCIVPNTLPCIYSCTFIQARHMFLFEPLIYSKSCSLRASVQLTGTHTYNSQKIQFVDTIPHLNKTRAYFFSPLKLIPLTNTMKWGCSKILLSFDPYAETISLCIELQSMPNLKP